ncbi:MAG: extracellular solute-binding protein [Oscillospiraceae bacterium]|nr:extracellular solute-binding protein [Oscillospiraceae bacterium]
MSKRIVALLLIAVLTIGMLTACGGSGKKGTAGDVVATDGGFDINKPVTITFYHQMGAELQKILATAIEDFNKLYPNITVKAETMGDYDGILSQIQTEISVGNQPNLAYCYADHVATYNLGGAVQPLDSLIANTEVITRADGSTEVLGLTQEQIDDFIPAFYNDGRVYGDGKMYTLPVVRSTEALYYNKTFFEKHGLTVPTTWDEMEAVCRQIRELEPTCIPLGYDSEANWFITMCEQYGSPYTSTEGDKFLFDNDVNKAFVKRFQGWYKEKLVTTQELSGGYTSALFTGESDTGTRCYMCIGSTGGATYQQPNQTNGVFEFEVGMAPIPQVDPANPKVISQGPSICVFRKSDSHETVAAWLFAKFLATDVVFQASVSMNNGYASVLKSAQENPVYKEFLATAGTEGIQAYAVQVTLDQQDSFYNSPAFFGSSVAREQVGLLVQKCLAVETNDVDAAIATAFQEAVKECKYQVGM